VLAAAVAVVSLAGATAASATPLRTPSTASYTDATFIQDTFPLITDAKPAIEPVTYDRFQWLLQQPGNYAFLIGDPAEDTTFAARAADVEADAVAAGVKKVYWFDPNLSGSAKVGGTTEPNLDIRNPAGITTLAAASQKIYGYAWLNLVGQYLGDGVTATPASQGTESATVTATTGTTTSNDYGSNATYSTEVGNTSGGALYDYTSGNAPANVSDSYFFIYNKDHTVSAGGGTQPQKIVSWVDLTKEASSTTAQTDVTTAIGTVGAANLTETDQSAWWQSEVNSKEDVQASSHAQGGDGSDPVLGASDVANWRVDQVPYPELVDLLKSSATASATAVILFGGTWCPNTRPVLPFINRYAAQNNVEVFNFDTVLDGGTVGGGTTSSSNPLQSRNSAASGTTTNANPTFLYGDLVRQYLKNIQTQYQPTVGDGFVTYYPGGDTTKTLTTVNKLQVPFLIGYQAGGTQDTNASGAGVTRQWIEQNTDTSGLPYYTEYMSVWWFTNPLQGELGLSIPSDAPIWSTLNSELATNYTNNPNAYQFDPSKLWVNTGTDSDDASFISAGGNDWATVTYNTTKQTLTVASATSSTSGAINLTAANLSAALSALGASAPVNYAAAKTAYIAAYTASPTSATTTELATVVAYWGLAQSRKNSINQAWGSTYKASTPVSPSSVAGGADAVQALNTFFGGLPGAAIPNTPSVSATQVDSSTAAQLTFTLTNQYGRQPTAGVSLTLTGNGTTVTGTAPLTQQSSTTYPQADTTIVSDAASFTLPVLPAGSYSYTLTYPGDSQLAAAPAQSGTLTVTQAPAPATPVSTPVPAPVSQVLGSTVTVTKLTVSKVTGSVSKAPTSKASGKYRVTIATPSGHSTATGNVTIKIKKGSTIRTLTGALAHGAVTFTVPKLAKGTWTVAISWLGDANYLAATATGATIKVTK
jgi:hypothetical protein